MLKMVVVTDNYYNIWIRQFGRLHSDPRIPSWIRYFRFFRIPVTALISLHLIIDTNIYSHFYIAFLQ